MHTDRYSLLMIFLRLLLVVFVPNYCAQTSYISSQIQSCVGFIYIHLTIYVHIRVYVGHSYGQQLGDCLLGATFMIENESFLGMCVSPSTAP